VLADALQCNLHVPANGHAGAALGAARLGRLALGEDEASVCRTQPSTRVFEPRPNAFLCERQLRFAELVKSSTRA
jgi:xylulokinase